MRALLALIAGGPGRVSTSAAAIIVIVFVLSGHGWDLARTVWFASLAAAGFVFLFAVLAVIAASTGVADGDSTMPAPKEADHG